MKRILAIALFAAAPVFAQTSPDPVATVNDYLIKKDVSEAAKNSVIRDSVSMQQLIVTEQAVLKNELTSLKADVAALTQAVTAISTAVSAIPAANAAQMKQAVTEVVNQSKLTVNQ